MSERPRKKQSRSAPTATPGGQTVAEAERAVVEAAERWAHAFDPRFVHTEEDRGADVALMRAVDALRRARRRLQVAVEKADNTTRCAGICTRKVAFRWTRKGDPRREVFVCDQHHAECLLSRAAEAWDYAALAAPATTEETL